MRGKLLMAPAREARPGFPGFLIYFRRENRYHAAWFRA